MGATRAHSPLTSYRDVVTELIDTGEPFSDVGQIVDGFRGLTSDEAAALWQFAFSLRGRAKQQRDARAHLAAVH